MGLRNSSALVRSPQEDNSQNPDSSSEKLDVTEVDEESKDVKEFSKENADEKNEEKREENERKSYSEGINLSLRVRKAAITLVRQKDEVSSSDRDDLKCSRDSNRNVWRPY